jgi:DNA (cytosine-5)-methyltransferase 1
MKKKLKVVDLFSGCGGLSIGFEMTGKFEVVAGNDFDRDSLQAFSANHPNAQVWEGSISDLDPHRLMADLGLKRGELDVLVGGPPCQGFSRNRARRHFDGKFQDDPRNYLFKEFLRFAEAFLPRALLIENVPDMIVKENGRFEHEICEALDGMGYQHHRAAVLNAANFGVPQRRRRAIILASREGVISLPEPTNSNESDEGRLFQGLPWLTIRDAIGDLPSLPEGGGGVSPGPYASAPQNAFQELLRAGAAEVSDHVSWMLSKVQSERLRHLGPGDGFECLPPDLAPKSGYGSAYRRMSWDIPALTITTWMYHPGSGMFFHPSDHRTITVREGARLQSFPDNTVFVGGKVSRCRQVGNAVPPLLAQALAKQVHSRLS